ncbi:hypothetical protein MASR1M68_08590 [Elusimicrobiota bacterium]
MNNKQLNTSFSIFIIISFAYAIFNFSWWQIYTPVVLSGMSAIHFIDIFRDGNLFYNAPLVTYIMRFMFFMFGKEYYDLIIIFVNYIFFLIPLYFIYKIGVELKDKETGNIAMILFALVPAVYGMSRQYGHQDYHIIAGITFNIYCLIKTDYFKNKKWTIWYGISVGLGLMIKDAFLAYFFVPFVYIAIAGLREKIEKTKIINILISILIGSLIAGWHYFRPEIIIKVIKEPIIEQQPIFAFESLRVMTTGLWEELLSPPIFIIFIIGLIFFILKYKGKYKNIILLWFFVPWAIIMLMPHNKMSEYGLGFIPATVLFGAVFISYIRREYVKKIILTIVIIIGFFQYVSFSYDIYIEFFEIQFKYKNNLIKYYDKYNPLVFYNVKESKKPLNLINRLKKDYQNNTFYIEEFCKVDSGSIVSQMYLNNMYCRQGNYDNKDLLLSDIIIVIGKPKTVRKVVELKINKILENAVISEMVTEEFISELLNEVDNNFNEISRQYDVIDIFYLERSKDEDTKVTLLGKKYKFFQLFE